MKRVLAALLLSFLLTACGAETERQTPDSPGRDLVLEMEHEVYDPSLTRYTYFVRNGTDKEVTLGESFDIQYLEGEQWSTPAWWNGGAWHDAAYRLLPGETRAMTCFLGGAAKAPEGGSYRLVKEIGGRTLYAEFRIGESPYTADTPYGFAPLEDRADGPGELDTVLTRDGLQNPETLEAFLFKIEAGADCQLRTVQDYGAGTVTDVIYESGRFLRRERRGEGAVKERWFSFLVTDGTDLYLSNAADWKLGEQYGEEREKLIPRGAAEEMIAAVERSMAKRLENGGVHYQVWSPDGEWSAALTDQPTEFLVERVFPDGSSAGASRDLLDWDGTETDILSLTWEEGNTLLLNCETLFGGRSRLLCYDPERDDMTSVQGLRPWNAGLSAAGRSGGEEP